MPIPCSSTCSETTHAPPGDGDIAVAFNQFLRLLLRDDPRPARGRRHGECPCKLLGHIRLRDDPRPARGRRPFELLALSVLPQNLRDDPRPARGRRLEER